MMTEQNSKRSAMTTLKISLTSLASAIAVSGLTACSPMKAALLETAAVTKTDDSIEKADALSCLATQPDYELATQVISFEMTSGVNGKVGFNGLGGILSAIGLGGSYSSGKLSMAMHLTEPAKMTGMTLLDSNGSSSFSKMTFDASFDVWLAGLSIGTYSQTPLADLSAQAVQSTVSNLLAGLRTTGLENEWSTHISKIKSSNEFIIPVGKNAGLRVGDELKIYNAEYEWEDQPCSSALLMARRLSDKPAALAVVKQVDTESAYLLVTSHESDDVVQKYAVVMASKLVGSDDKTSPRTSDSLARSLRIGSVVASQKLRFQTSTGAYQDVDLTPFIAQQISTIVRDPNYGGFYLKK